MQRKPPFLIRTHLLYIIALIACLWNGVKTNALDGPVPSRAFTSSILTPRR